MNSPASCSPCETPSPPGRISFAHSSLTRWTRASEARRRNGGSRLKALSLHFQILCITHLPQIAVFAQSHLKVSKQILKDRTFFQIQTLEQKGREEEIARMLGGIQLTQKTYAHAREMLARGARKEGQ